MDSLLIAHYLANPAHQERKKTNCLFKDYLGSRFTDAGGETNNFLQKIKQLDTENATQIPHKTI